MLYKFCNPCQGTNGCKYTHTHTHTKRENWFYLGLVYLPLQGSCPLQVVCLLSWQLKFFLSVAFMYTITPKLHIPTTKVIVPLIKQNILQWFSSFCAYGLARDALCHRGCLSEWVSVTPYLWLSGSAQGSCAEGVGFDITARPPLKVLK